MFVFGKEYVESSCSWSDVPMHSRRVGARALIGRWRGGVLALSLSLPLLLVSGVDGGDERVRRDSSAGGSSDPTGAVPDQQSRRRSGSRGLHRIPVRARERCA